MDYYIGVNRGPHDSSVSVVNGDGKVVMSVNEERFSRVKYNLLLSPDMDISPHRALKCALDYCKDGEIKAIGLNVPAKLQSIAEKNFKSFYEYDKISSKLRFYSHHLCHGAATLFSSGFGDDTLVFTCDSTEDIAKTDPLSMTLWKYKDNKFTLLEKLTMPYSIGASYSLFTYILFGDLFHAGKLMGLAAYGNVGPAYSFVAKYFPDIIGFTGVGENFFNKMVGMRSADHITKVGFKVAENIKNQGNFSREDIAAATQKLLEEKIFSMIAYIATTYGNKKIVLGGGVFHNVYVNNMIRKTGLFSDMYVYPDAGDSGISLGAAYLVAQESGVKSFPSLKSMYLGPSYESVVEPVLNRMGVAYTRMDDDELVKYVAEKLKYNSIVAWYRGRMEAGPRALGHRSILVSPTNAENKTTLNALVKHRESFRPFGPSVVDTKMKKYSKDSVNHKYMIEAFEVDEKVRASIPAVVHVDGTFRPQAVSENDDPVYYALLKKFGNLTGEYCLLNTSFNIAGEPIICTPQEAINAFSRGGIDVLVLGNCVVTKQ